MGQQISHVGDRNSDAVCEHEATGSVAEADCRHLSSGVQKLIKLLQSRLGARVRGRSRHSVVGRQQLLLQEGVSVTSSTETCDVLPPHFTDISAVDVSLAVADERDVGMAVADVLRLYYCHLPVTQRRKADSCTVHCQTASDSIATTHVSSDCSLAGTSFAEPKMFTTRNDKVENDAATSKVFDLSRNEDGMDAKSRFNSTECDCRRRPPPSPKLITSPVELAHETRPPEIGSYLAVAPALPSSDLGLSPIDETAEVMPSAALLSPENTADVDKACEQTPAKLSTCDFCSHALSAGYNCTAWQPSVYIVCNSLTSQVDNSAALTFDNSSNVIFQKAAKVPESNEGIVNGQSLVNTPVSTSVRNFSEDGCLCSTNTDFCSVNDDAGYCGRRIVGDAVEVNGSVPSDAVLSDIQASCVADKCRHSPSQSFATQSPHRVFLCVDSSVCSVQTSSPWFVLADAVSLSDDSAASAVDTDTHCTTCCKLSRASETLQVPDIQGVETSASEAVWTESETALPCRDWSTNNNESSKPRFAVSPATGPVVTSESSKPRVAVSPATGPVVASESSKPRVAVSPTTGPMVARCQVRQSSDGCKVAAVARQMSTCGTRHKNVYHDCSSTSTSQTPRDDSFVSPPTDHRDCQQLEKFEGWYSCHLLDRGVVVVVNFLYLPVCFATSVKKACLNCHVVTLILQTFSICCV